MRGHVRLYLRAGVLYFGGTGLLRSEEAADTGNSWRQRSLEIATDEF